uniref:Uncharacterized protein n=1 Tax=Panagrolaimus superbus TaxID=310955 RepID=A0A914Y9J0_9BILA
MMLRLIVFLVCIKSLTAIQCWTCDTKCGCRNPIAEQCPSTTKCYTLKSLTTGDIVRKGCARDCLSVNQNDKICETCDNDRCNSEQSLIPMNGEFDECRETQRLEPLAYNSNTNGIGQGTGYGGSPNIGSGTGYNGGGIGSGTGYNGPNYNDGQGPRHRPGASGIGSGTGYNAGIGSGTGYNPNPNIGSGTGGNYYPSPNFNQPQNRGGYGDYPIGQGTYNSASQFVFHVIPVSICLILAQIF